MGIEQGGPRDISSPAITSGSYQNDSVPPLKTTGLIIELEIGIVILVTLLGAGIRSWGLSQMGMSHFDAGIYAQSGLWPWTGAFHFQQGYYSPPLYPLLIGVVNILAGGPVDWAGPLISVLAGTALIPVCWWVGRSWFSQSAGLLAAFLVALDGLQIVFSRVGLTDELFTLFFLAGLAAVRSAIEHGGWRRILLAGLLVGLAWNTKYNGFLPLALGAGFLFDHPFVRRATRLALTSLISLTLYLPWALWFHVEHGYETLIAHQRGYFHGPAGAAGNWAEFLHDMDIVGTPTLGIGIAFLVFLSRGEGRAWGLLALAIIGLIANTIDIIGWPWIVWLPAAYFSAWRSSKQSDRFGLLWMLTWLLVLPSLYTPYLRLWLPTETIFILMAAGGLAWLADPSLPEWGPAPEKEKWLARRLASVLVALLLITYLPGFPSGFCFASNATGRNGTGDRQSFWVERAYRPQTGDAGIQDHIATYMHESGRVFTFTKPPLTYHLMQSNDRIHPLAGDPLNLNELGPDDVLIVDRALLDTPSFRPTFDAAMGKMSPMILGPFNPDIVTLLDDYHGANLRRDLPYFLQQYRVFSFRQKRPAQSNPKLLQTPSTIPDDSP